MKHYSYKQNHTAGWFGVKKLSLFLVLLCVSISIQAQRVINLNDEGAGIRAASSSVIPQEFLAEAKAARAFAINPVLQRAGSVEVGDIVNLQLFESSNYKAEVSRITNDANGNFTLTLRFPDCIFAFAIITTDTEGRSLVNVSAPMFGQRYESRHNINTGRRYLIEVDKNRIELPPRGLPIIPQEEKMIEVDEDGNAVVVPRTAVVRTLDCGPDLFDNPNAPATIDLMIVLTTAAVARANTHHGGVNNLASAIIAENNLVFSNSQTGITIRQAGPVQIVNYVEPTPSNMGATLTRMRTFTHGFENIRTLRTQHNADLVQLFTMEYNAGGMGYLPGLSSIVTPDWGFSAVSMHWPLGHFISAHEIGHNMGLGHGAQQINANRARGIWDYSHGWRFEASTNNPWNNRWRNTVMSYQGGGFFANGLTSLTVPFFSNPNLNYPLGGAVMGNAATADASRSLREVKHVVASYSDILTRRLALNVTNVVVSNPTNHGATFTWDPVPGAVNYRVIGPAGWFFTTSNTTFTVNNSGANWFPNACTVYQFSIRAVNECGDVGDAFTSTFRTLCATDPTVTTQTATNITPTTATLNRTVTINNTPVTSQGFEFRVSGATAWTTTTNNNLTGLTPSTTYQFRAFARTEFSIFYGSTMTFTTLAQVVAPTVVTQAATNITQTTATLNKTVTAGTETITSQGFEFRVSGATGWTSTTNANLTGLTANTTYEFRAFAVTASGTTHGSTLTFTTLHTPPTVTTQAATNITQTTATLNKSVTAGTETITSQGFEFRVSGATTWTSTTNANLTGLTANTTYEFRAFAVTASGTTHGSTLTFTTLHTPPAVTTQAATNITQTTATLNKTVTAGTETITSQGFEFRVSGATTWTSTTNANLTGLTANTTYEFRAFAVTASGTVHGSTLTFTTLAHTAPTVVTQQAADVTHISATLNKTVTAGTETITSQGFEYRVSEAASWQTSADGNLTGLTANTTYQFRAFAITASGTTYGDVLTFTTAIFTAPLVTFRINAIEADEILHPTCCTARGTIRFDVLATDGSHNKGISFTLALAFEDYVLYLDGERLEVIGESADFLFGDILNGWTGVLYVVRPSNGTRRAIDGTIVAVYDLIIVSGTDIGVNINNPTVNREVQSVQCYTVTGIRIDCDRAPQGNVIIQRTIYTDGSVEVETRVNRCC